MTHEILSTVARPRKMDTNLTIIDACNDRLSEISCMNRSAAVERRTAQLATIHIFGTPCRYLCFFTIFSEATDPRKGLRVSENAKEGEESDIFLPVL